MFKLHFSPLNIRLIPLFFLYFCLQILQVQIVPNQGDILEVSYLKDKGSYFAFPEKADVSWVPVKDVTPLPEPKIDRRQHYNWF